MVSTLLHLWLIFITFMVGVTFISDFYYIISWLLLHLSVLQLTELMATKVISSSVRKYDKHHAGAVPEEMQVRTN